MENVRRYVLTITPHVATGVLVQHDKAGGIGSADFFVSIVHAGSGVEVEAIAVNKDGGVRGVVRPDARARGEVEEPEDGFVASGDGARRGVGGGAWDLGGVETHDFAPVVDEIDEAAVNGDGRGDTALRPVEIWIFFTLGNDELPEGVAGLFVEAHENAAVALFARIAWVAVVGADVNAATGDDGCGMGFGTKLSGPSDVLTGFWIEGVGEVAFVGNHVARPCLAELGLVGGKKFCADGKKSCAEEQRN